MADWTEATTVDELLQHDWPPARSAGAAARQLVLSLGCVGREPRLAELLTEMLADANRASHDRQCILQDFKNAAPEQAAIAAMDSFIRGNPHVLNPQSEGSGHG